MTGKFENHNPRLGAVSTHHWLKHSDESTFHAYLVRGKRPICGHSEIIIDVCTMDIPGDFSPCCVHCFKELYGFDPYANPSSKDLI